MDGEAFVHVTTDEQGGTTTWIAPDADLPRDAIIQLVSADVATDAFAGIMYEPLGFPCSEFGGKVVKVAKYLWIGAAYAAQIVCCVGGLTVGCVVCGLGAEVAKEAGSDALEDYCD